MKYGYLAGEDKRKGRGKKRRRRKEGRKGKESRRDGGREGKKEKGSETGTKAQVCQRSN